MPVHFTFKCASVILQRNFDLFYSISEKACLHVYVPLNTLAKFRANLHNSENRYNGKEA
jgi:hypothetical protein